MYRMADDQPYQAFARCGEAGLTASLTSTDEKAHERRLADFAATPQRLAALQRDLLVPLELMALDGSAELSTRAGAVSYLRNRLPLPAAQDR
jgi:hypothetical protein